MTEISKYKFKYFSVLRTKEKDIYMILNWTCGDVIIIRIS